MATLVERVAAALTAVAADVKALYANKQSTLVSGTSIKTVNGASLLGSGDLSGLATVTGTETLTNKTLTGAKETKVSVSASDIDLSAGNFFTKTISAATTFTVSNVPASGATASIILELTNAGAYTISWWSGVKWASGTAPTLTTSGVDILGFYSHDGGTTWRGMVLAKDSK